MDAPTTRIFTPARIVALVLIGLAVFGLTYLRFEPDAGPVSVPEGARAGELTLKPCSYDTEKGSYAADCGTLVVPENRANPRSRLIALPVTRIRARSERSGEPVFRLEGGPGQTNMKFSKASRVADEHDVVMVGYRGVDGSSVLDCPEVTSALKRSTDLLGEKSFHAYSDAFRSCAERLQADGVDLAGYSLAQRVDDLEAARVALGYDRVDLLSESAGTRAAMIYSWRYPRSIHRSVMIGVNPPGHFLWNPRRTDEQLQRYADLCSKDGTCRDRTDDLAASMRRTAADIPDRWLFLPIKEGNVRVGSFYGLAESTSEAGPLSAPMVLESWLDVGKGDSSGFWLVSLMAGLTVPESFVWGEMAATARMDADVARRYFSSGGDRGSVLGDPGTEFAWAGGRLVDAWPATPDEDEYDRVRTTEGETLLIGGTLDFSTPPANAAGELLPFLPNGHQVVLAELGHTTDFWSYQPEASSRLINTFYDTGQVDDTLYHRRKMDFETGISYAAIAKIVAGTMVGLAIVAVLSLLWMPRRVHTLGSFGPRAGASMRSLYAIVLGAGGWCLGALIVMTTMPGVPLDSELLAVLSAGVPIGLGIYWAWVHRDWSATSKRVGLAAVVGGALVGAWLGFNAIEGLLALLTTLAGAILGGNLILLALDVAWDRQARDRFAETAAKETLEARPSAG